jgi:predicted helicase
VFCGHAGTGGKQAEGTVVHDQGQRRACGTPAQGPNHSHHRQPALQSWAKDEDENNKNREYKVVEDRLRATYVKDSTATLRNKLYDPYVKFFRWASDRLQGRDGVVCLVSNNSFLEQRAFDGMRKHLAREYSSILHVNLRGKVRDNPELSGTAYNVFGIQVGVGISLCIKKAAAKTHSIRYVEADLQLRREQKLEWLASAGSFSENRSQPNCPEFEWRLARR